MAEETETMEFGENESRRRSKNSSKARKPSYSRKGRKREEGSPNQSPTRIDFKREETDLSSLEIISPTGSILNQQEATHRGKRLDWGFKVALSAEKVQDPAIYTCELCDLPILIYGRLIPCKHVFCFDCAKDQTEKICPRCRDPFARIEQSALGTVFICTYGGGKQTPRGCKRTYLSQRDLNAHIQHRHKKPSGSGGHSAATVAASTVTPSTSSASNSSLTNSSISNPISQQIVSTLPGNIDLSNLNSITDAQLKQAADILAATINAGKSTKPSAAASSDSAPGSSASTAPPPLESVTNLPAAAVPAYPPVGAPYPPQGPPPSIVNGAPPTGPPPTHFNPAGPTGGGGFPPPHPGYPPMSAPSQPGPTGYYPPGHPIGSAPGPNAATPPAYHPGMGRAPMNHHPQFGK